MLCGVLLVQKVMMCFDVCLSRLSQRDDWTTSYNPNDETQEKQLGVSRQTHACLLQLLLEWTSLLGLF